MVFKKGSNRAFVDLAFNEDGLWEGIEKGKLVVDKIDGPKMLSAIGETTVLSYASMILIHVTTDGAIINKTTTMG